MRDHPSDGEQLRATRRRPRRMGGRAPACSARASQTRSCTWIRLGHQGHWSTSSTSSVTEAAMPSFSTLRSPSSASATDGVVDTLSKYQRRPRVLSGAGGCTSTTSPRSRSCGYRPTQARLKALCTTAGSAARDSGPSMPAYIDETTHVGLLRQSCPGESRGVKGQFLVPAGGHSLPCPS